VRRVRFWVDGEVHVGVWRDDHAVSAGRTWPQEAVRLLAPVTPSKIVCLGRNYAAHAEELGHKVPERPLLFFKPPSSVIGPGEAVVLPRSRRVDFEGELAIVIGQRCRNVSVRDAECVICGYTCLNDVTDRAAQGWEVNWVRAKGFDTACPIGPWVVSADELEFPLVLETWVNGVLRQNADTSLLNLGVREIVEEISAVMTLEPGDVIATGTPAGVGPLTAGDTVEVRISGIGGLSNPVRAQD